MARVEKREISPARVVLNAMTYAKIPNVVEAEQFMRMQYEIAFGIYDHNQDEKPDVPFPLLAVSPRESLSVVDPLKFRLDQYADNKVGDVFKISFDVLITYCRHDYLLVIESAKKHNERAERTGSGTMNTLEANLKKIMSGAMTPQQQAQAKR